MNKPTSENILTELDSTETIPGLPDRFAVMMAGESGGQDPHPLCVLAAQDLQRHLDRQVDWSHNFGSIAGPARRSVAGGSGSGSRVIGKMFGVLVVRDTTGCIGYLAGFSGKLAGSNSHSRFVPPVFDALKENSFLNRGMRKLSVINAEIEQLEEARPADYDERVVRLKVHRRQHSNALQEELFDHYSFLNRAGELKSLRQIFQQANYKNPPSGAGECAGPKLLRFAFQHGMQPLAMAEFWWGESPKSSFWKHGQFYGCCREKCQPILTHMLSGID